MNDSRAAGIAGACFLLCILILAGMWMWNTLGMLLPHVGDMAAWLWCPQFVLGMFFMVILVWFGVLVFAWESPRG